ncbi:MAG: S9 family peptidase [Bacteroidales bacterium]|nr:S9 family peptidase [Bacteroidales bacterium]
MKKLLLATILSISIVLSFSQNKLLTAEDCMNPALYPERLNQLQWIPSSNNYTYIKNKAIIKGDFNKTDTLLKLSDFNKLLISIKEKELNGFPSIKWININEFTFSIQSNFYKYNLSQQNITLIGKIDEKAENIDINYKTLKTAYTIDNNLFISKGDEQVQITKDENKEIVNGQTVHRNEFGIDKGIFWSPQGNFIAFYRMDQTMVTDYPLVDIGSRIAEIEKIKYPMAGMKSHEVTVGIYNLKTNQTIYLNTGEPKEQYLTNLSWSPDEKYLYIAVLNREQNHLKLNKYNISSGNLETTLFEEKNNNWVEPLNGLYFLNKNKDLFIWQSKKDGYNHLYLYNDKGEQIKQLTKGKWEVIDISGISPDDKEVYFSANISNPIEKQIYSVDIKTGKITRLSEKQGTHYPVFSTDYKYWIDYFSNKNTASEVSVYSKEEKKIKTLLENKDPLKDYKHGETTIFTIKAEDGTDLYCRLIKPVDFNPEKKYPVFVYVYGGPHSQLVTDNWLGGGGLFLNYIASQGYVVFTLDNRGTSNRGADFEQAIFRNLGDKEAKDQFEGIKYLKKLNYTDTTDFTINGWSYGGFMTITMLLKYPGVFRAGVAGGPVTDWKYYEVMYGERYMDTPETNPEGYKNSSLINNINSLKDKLLIIHCTMDDTVVWQQSLSLLKEAINNGIMIDYFVYPGHKHNVSGKDRIHLYKKIYEYISK